jgi:hypothetical protein
MGWVEAKNQKQSFINKFLSNLNNFIKKKSFTGTQESDKFNRNFEETPFTTNSHQNEAINSNFSINENLFREKQKNETSLIDPNRASYSELKSNLRGAHWQKGGFNSNIELIKNNCHVLKTEVTLEEITFSSLEGKNIVKDHIILCGLSDNLQKFFIPLRHKSLKMFPSIVILHEEPPDVNLWMKIKFFPKLYFVQGSSLNPKDLKKVNLQKAYKVVLLNDPLLKQNTDKSEK